MGLLSRAGLHGRVPSAKRRPYGPDRLREGVDVHRDGHEARAQCESRAILINLCLTQ